MPVMNFGAQDIENHMSGLGRLAALCEMGSDSSGDESEGVRRPPTGDRTQELTDYVLTTMRQLARISAGLSTLVPGSQQQTAAAGLMHTTASASPESTGRLWNTLHKLNATADTIVDAVQAGDITLQALDLTLLPPDPSMALETINVKLLSAQKKIYQRTASDHLVRTTHSVLDDAWQKGEEVALESARRSLSAWRTSAADLKTKVAAALASPETSPVELLQNVQDFLSSLTVCKITSDAPTEADVQFKATTLEEHAGRLQASFVASMSTSTAGPRTKHNEGRKRPLSKHLVEPIAVEKRRRPSTSPYALPNRKPAAETPSHLQGVRTYVPSKKTEGDGDVEYIKEATEEGSVVDAAPVGAATPIGCEICHENNAHEQMLLCDNNCGHEYHLFCLNPPLEDIPEGDWFCPSCEQNLCLAQKCKRVCVLSRKYCSRHLCKDGSCGFRAKKAGYCGKHAKLLLRYESDDDLDSDMGR